MHRWCGSLGTTTVQIPRISFLLASWDWIQAHAGMGAVQPGQSNTLWVILWQSKVTHPSKILTVQRHFHFCFHQTLLPWREWRYELHFFGPGNYGGWQAPHFTWKCDIFPCNYWDLYGFIMGISLLVSRPGHSRFHYNMEHVKKLQWIYIFVQM